MPRRVLPLWLMLSAFVGAVSAQVAHPIAGRPVQEVLRDLQSTGLRILFADSLVTPKMRVTAEPRATTPLGIAGEILDPHGLALKRGPGTTWLVVRAVRPPKVTSNPAAPASTATSRVESDPQTVTYRLEERVTVSQSSGDLAGQPAAYAFDVSRISETAGALENVLQALPSLPGVAAVDDRNGGLTVRGAGPEHSVIVIDGALVHNPQRPSDFGASFVNPSTIGSLGLDASGLDARYGGRLSSTTVIETRDGDLERRVAVSGSAGLTAGDVLVEGRLPGTTSGSWWVTSRGTYYKFVADRLGGLAVPGFVDVQFKVTTAPTSRTRLSVFGLLGKEALTRPLRGEFDPRTIEKPIEIELQTTNALVAANLRWTPAGRVTMLTTGTAYRNHARYQDHWILPAIGAFDRRIAIDDVAIRQRVSLAPRDNHLIDVGGEVRLLTSRWAMRGAVLPPVVRPVGPDIWGSFVFASYAYPGPIDAPLDKTIVSGWVQDRIAVPAGVVLEPGLRVDRNSLTREAALQPRLRVSRSFGRTDLWTGLAWQVQTPGFETMQQGLAYFDLAGAPAGSLRNERARQVVAGLQHQWANSTTLRVEAYARSFDRLLVQRQESDAERAQRLSLYLLPPDIPAESAILEHRPMAAPESVGTGRAVGVEVLAQHDRGRLSWWIAYTLSKAERELYGATVPFDYDRRHALVLSVDLRVFNRIHVALSSKYASGFPLTPLSPEPFFSDYGVPKPGPGQKYVGPYYIGDQLMLGRSDIHPLRLSRLNSERMPSYARTDTRVVFDVNRRLSCYGEVINVFDRYNFEPEETFGFEGSEVARGRYKVALRIPRLLTYGIRVRF